MIFVAIHLNKSAADMTFSFGSWICIKSLRAINSALLETDMHPPILTNAIASAK
jgi:hypothetical protein